MAKTRNAVEPTDEERAALDAAVAEVFDMDAVLGGKRPARGEITITLDPNAEPPTVVTFTFQAIGRPAWEELLDKHPPTPEQSDEHRAEQIARGARLAETTQLRWNADTFPPAAISACAVKPTVTLRQAQRLWTDPRWNQGELRTLFNAVLVVNNSSSQITVGKGLPPILDFGPS